MPAISRFRIERKFGTSVFKLSLDQLDSETRLKILEQTIKVAAEGFRQDPKDEVFRQDVADHVLNTPELYLVYTGKECIAFAAIEHFEARGIPVLYLGGLMVKRDFQGNGLMKDLISLEIGLSKPRVLVARTQNPCILDLMKSFCEKEKIYPFTGFPKGDCQTVSEFLNINRGGFDSKTLIGLGTYGRCLYGDGVPKSNHPQSNLFMERIDPQMGDSILFIGEVAYEKK